MATLDGYYLNPHVSQFDGSIHESENCTPTTGANGANAATGGKVALTGAQVRALLPRSEETDPSTPGWSLEDLDHAMARWSAAHPTRPVGFTVKSGQGWAALIADLNAGHYVALQGDSDQFSDATCSGKFNGDHCVGIHPATRVLNGLRQHWIDDPICKTGRWEYDYILHRYAAKLNASIRYGIFTTPVPKASPPPPPPTTYTLHIDAGAKVRVAWIASTGCINGWVDRIWGSSASSAPCLAPVSKRICNTTATAKVAYVTAGTFRGKFVHIGTGVTVK